jgi:predicted GH43/DUF377 family glycosyl hydrolase
MLFRAIGNDWISRLGYAESDDGINFFVLDRPVFTPSGPSDSSGVEDPRLVKIDDTFWLTYTAFDGKTARAALTSSKDLIQYNSRKILFPNWQHSAKMDFPADWSKSAGIIPQAINGRYYMVFGDSHIWMATSANLIDWEPNPNPIITGRPGSFDAAYVEMGPPPILTEHGWLVLYHGVDNHDPAKTYRLGAALLDKNDPTKVIWRCKQPLLEPTEPYETVGFVDVIEGGFETLKNITIEDLHELKRNEKLPTAVFCCGAVLETNHDVRIYYGAGDTVICTAVTDLETIFQL